MRQIFDKQTTRERVRESLSSGSQARERGTGSDVMLLFAREVGGWSLGAWPERSVSRGVGQATARRIALPAGVHRGSLPRQQQSVVNAERGPRGVVLQRGREILEPGHAHL